VIEQIEQIEQPAPQLSDAPDGAAPPPPRSAQTVEQFDTTTDAQREAAATTSTGGTLLGEAVATLGDPSVPGFWIETPLVETAAMGHIVFVDNGKSAAIELRPTTGASTRVSLAALRLLEAPLTDLVTLEVYQN